MTNEEAKRKVKGYLTDMLPSDCSDEIDEIMKVLEQQPFINKPCISKGVCREDKIQVLEKIRAEIEDLTYYSWEISPRTVIDDVLEIIDKYKSESENKK